jgi:hypothetical protein
MPKMNGIKCSAENTYASDSKSYFLILIEAHDEIQENRQKRECEDSVKKRSCRQMAHCTFSKEMFHAPNFILFFRSSGEQGFEASLIQNWNA